MPIIEYRDKKSNPNKPVRNGYLHNSETGHLLWYLSCDINSETKSKMSIVKEIRIPRLKEKPSNIGPLEFEAMYQELAKHTKRKKKFEKQGLELENMVSEFLNYKK